MGWQHHFSGTGYLIEFELIFTMPELSLSSSSAVSKANIITGRRLRGKKSPEEISHYIATPVAEKRFSTDPTGCSPAATAQKVDHPEPQILFPSKVDPELQEAIATSVAECLASQLAPAMAHVLKHEL